MKKAFLLISAGMLGYLGPGSMAVASEVPSELPEQPITMPASGSSSRSTSNSAGTTINQQTNTQENNDQFHGFGLGIRCPTPTLGFSLYGGGGAGGSGLDGGVSTSAYGGMITLNLPLGNRNRRTCEELGEAQLRAVQAQTARTQLEAAKVRADINLVTIQQCLTILQSARLSGRFADACAGVDLAAQGQTPQFSDRSPPGEGGAVVAHTPPSPQPVVHSTVTDPSAVAMVPPPDAAVVSATQGEVVAIAPPPAAPVASATQGEVAAIAPPPAAPVASATQGEVAAIAPPPAAPVVSPPEGGYPVIAPPPPVQASLPSIARVPPIAPAVPPPLSAVPVSAPPQAAPGAIAPSPARSPIAPPAPPAATTVSPVTELPAIARIPTHRPRPTATVSFPETTDGVAFARDGGPWSGR